MAAIYAPPTTADRRNARADSRAAARDAANREAADAARAAGYAELDGTPAQVAWATTIRHGIAQAAQDRITRAIAAGDPASAVMLDALDAMLETTDASWWIDSRNGIRVPFGAYFETVSTFEIALYARRRAQQ